MRIGQCGFAVFAVPLAPSPSIGSVIGVVNSFSVVPTVWVALGGALGSVARFKLAGWVSQSYAEWTFPLGTFVVNVLGCFVIGFLAALSQESGLISADTRAFLFTGILGGFTTFSAFGLETFNLLRRGEFLVAGSYVALSVFIGLLALWLGFAIIVPSGK